jgi:hypothetical protein
MMPNDNPPLISGEDWPYGYGMCCCGCGKKARVVNGVLQKFYRGYHESWLKKRKRLERGGASKFEKPLLPKSKTTRPNMYAIAEHLPVEFHLSQSEIEKAYSNLGSKMPTAKEREKQYPHLNAPTVELKNRFKNIIAAQSESDNPAASHPELLGGDEKSDRLKQQLAWIKANQPLLDAISRARSRVDQAVTWRRTRKREKKDVGFRLLQRIRGRISAALNGRVKDSSALKLIGCTLPELKAHLEKQFKADMSWSNYGKWHVDHIRPCASFDFNDPVSISQCLHYTNLQPMWKMDNIKKNSNWEGKLIRRKNPD